ncbi:MAG: hypothetical protein WCO56_21005 [Verrucomicrobiota bacterium]
MNDWFRKPSIQITPSIRPGRTSKLNPDVFPVTFMLDGKYRLTSLKVVSVDDIKTNKHPRVIWHMISDTASQPTKIIIYGAPIKGMKPSVPRARPDPLQANIPYRMFLEASDEYQGQVDFKTVEAVAPSAQN